MRRHTSEDLLKESAATPEDLADLENKRLLVPARRWRLFGRFGTCEDYFLLWQLEAMRTLIRQRQVGLGYRRMGC